MSDIAKIVVVTQQTGLDKLIAIYTSKEQVRFYLEYNGASFEEYLIQHNVYYQALRNLKRQIPRQYRYQVIERTFLPNFLFSTSDLVVVLGRDGLVINTAKYLDKQVILGINPDPGHIDGILLQFTINEVGTILHAILEEKAEIGRISVAEAVLQNGQKLVGVNDIFVGHQSHQSAQYTLRIGDRVERQSSSGVIISTGIGSTGWMKSIIATSIQITNHETAASFDPNQPYNFRWDADHLCYAVREAWTSNSTGNSLVFGKIDRSQQLLIESHMPNGGVIFSDGIERDRMRFNSGQRVSIHLSAKNIFYYAKSCI